MMSVRVLIYKCMVLLTIVAGIPSQPGLLFWNEFIIYVATSVSSIWINTILHGFGCKKSIGLTLVGARLASEVWPTETKYILNSFAISSALSILLLLIITLVLLSFVLLLVPITDFP